MAGTKKDWLAWVGVCALFAAMLWGILLIQQGDNRRFENRGVEASAQVVNKRIERERSSSGSGMTTEHYFDITFMNRVDVEESETSVDILEGEFEFGEIDIGAFQRAEVDVNRSSYEATAVGDDVTILFLPNDPSKARLADEVYNYSPTLMYILIGICGIGALYCFVRFLMAPATAPPSEFQEVYPGSS